MSGKSKNSEKALDPGRPFDPAILKKARKLVADYEIVLWFEDGEWIGRGFEIPYALADGKTPTACVASVREGLLLVVAYLLEEGELPPAPARTDQRTELISIRVTAEERSRLESRSRARGFRGLSDFIRTSILEKE